ncbi:MAG: serine/threonine protein kinase [Polyangiaceae bacterium]|jgi:serine/threonine protein kinase|nr:serine/threonine protein kinase [Polyangiaceae bacterium]
MSIEAKEHTEGDVVAEKFRVIRRLGRGGMGSVYEAEHVLTHRRVALKVMHAFDDDSETVRQRFLREARAACAIRHPAIVPVHDIFASGKGIVLVMDLLVGQTLFDLEEASPGRRVHPLMVVEHVLPIVSALGALHAAGFIHRDIKPENIFVTDGGSYLLDLGIVKDERSPTVTRLTTDGGIGTPLYMAPEQAFNKPMDHRVDMWSLGLVLYEALSGEVPTMAGSIGAIYQLIGAAAFRPLASVAPEVPEPIAKLVDAMIAGEPEQRPASMQIVYDTLAAHASSSVLARYARPDRPMKEQREGSTGPTAAPAPSTPRPKLALAETNAAAAGPAGARQSSVEAPPMTTPTRLPSRGASRGLLVAIGALSVVLVAGIGVLATLLATGRLGGKGASATGQASPQPQSTLELPANPTPAPTSAATAAATATSDATSAPSALASAPETATASTSAVAKTAGAGPRSTTTGQPKATTTSRPVITNATTAPPPPPPPSTGGLLFKPTP